MSVPTLLITGTTGVGKSTVAAEINDVLAALKVACEDFTVDNGNRSVREVALDVLVRAGWVCSSDRGNPSPEIH